MTSAWDDHDDEVSDLGGEDPPFFEPKPKRRGPGRPKGSKNRPRESLLTVEKLEALYNRVKPYLPDDQKTYIEGVISGENDVDALKEMKLLVRQMSILFSEASVWHFDNKRVTQDFANFANTLRAAIKDLNDMVEKEAARAKQQQETDDLVRITERGSALERLETLLRERPS